MELLRALAVVAEPPHREQLRLCEMLELPGVPTRVEHTELFDFQLSPYASVYLGSDAMIGGEARDRVAGFWRAMHLQPPPEPDHLVVLLALYASLCEREAAETDDARQVLLHEARRALLWEHLLSWLLPYLAKVEEVASPFYSRWAMLVSETLLAEAQAFGPCDRVPMHLREETDVPSPENDDAEALLRALLTPVRTGMLLTRADISRAALHLGIGARVSDRRFVLLNLLAEEPRGTLTWLSEEALKWRAKHAAWRPVLGPIAEYFERRARSATEMLGQYIATLPPLA